MNFSVGIFLDLSKAFDTVNHVILVDKLEHYGIRGLALDWIRSYSSNRKQYVEYNGHRSLRNEISCGVPEGFILGPLFFHCTLTTSTMLLLNLILFADDTNVFMSHRDPNYLSVMLNSERDKLSIWFKANKLSLNLKKTKFMVFKPRQKRSICHIQINIDNENIVNVKETNVLGVILDENLNWKSEISHVANKVAKSIGIISRCSFFLPKTSLRMLYCSLIYPYFYYCKIF